MWTGSFDKTINIWDVDVSRCADRIETQPGTQTKLLVQEITEEHQDTIRSMITVNNVVWTGCGELDGHIRLWKSATSQPVQL